MDEKKKKLETRIEQNTIILQRLLEKRANLDKQIELLEKRIDNQVHALKNL
jgi:hypothetical protein